MTYEHYKAQKMKMYTKTQDFLRKTKWARNIRKFVDYRQGDLNRRNGDVPINELIKIKTAILHHGQSKETNATEEIRDFLRLWNDFLLNQDSEFYDRILFELNHPRFDYDTRKKKTNYQKSEC